MSCHHNWSVFRYFREVSAKIFEGIFGYRLGGTVETFIVLRIESDEMNAFLIECITQGPVTFDQPVMNRTARGKAAAVVISRHIVAGEFQAFCNQFLVCIPGCTCRPLGNVP